MEGVFTLPYSEYEVINQLQKLLKKKDGYSVYVPVSRQQKGVDFVIHNSGTSKFLTAQVKSSRSYVHDPVGKGKDKRFRYHLWFANFVERYRQGSADLYILFGLYPLYRTKYKITSKKQFWRPLIPCFTDREMGRILSQARTKKEKKPDKFFGFGFTSAKEVFGTRGLPRARPVTDHLLKHQVGNIKKLLR